MAYVELVNLATAGLVPPNYRVQFNDRPTTGIVDPDSLQNWSSTGSPQRGWTKHHQVPWEVIRKIFNQALLNLQVSKDGGLWDAIRKASFVNGSAGSQQSALAAAKKGLNGLVVNWRAVPLPAVAAINVLLTGQRLALSNPAAPGLMPGIVDIADHIDAIEHLASRFCWMPGNMFLGPTPGSRLDNPPVGTHGFEGFDDPPKGKGGAPTTLLTALYTEAVKATPDWGEVKTLLGKLATEGVAKKGKLVHYEASDWNSSLLPGTNVNVYKKKLA